MNDFILFDGEKIRRILDEGEWYFSVVEVVGVLTESKKPRDYWYRIKVREKESSNGKEYLIDISSINLDLNFVGELKEVIRKNGD